MYRVHINLDLRHFGTNKAKIIVSIAKVSEKLIHVLKLLALVYPKHIQFRFKGKSFISKTSSHLNFRRLKKILLLMLDEIFSRTNLTVFPLINVADAYLISNI